MFLLIVGVLLLQGCNEASISEIDGPVSASTANGGELSSTDPASENVKPLNPVMPAETGEALAATGVRVGYYRITSGVGTADMVPPITAGGHTAVLLENVTANDLDNIDVLFIDNPSNSNYTGGGGEFVSALTDINNWVNAGGIMVFHDRRVVEAATVLPGGSEFDILRDFGDDSNIDVLDATTIVTNGPGGTVDNTTLDGGTSSSHGYAVDSSLPTTGSFILSRTAPAEVVTFSYCSGSGGVVYSTIPLDFYLVGLGPPAVVPNFRDVYAPNVVDYAAQGFCVTEIDVDIYPGIFPNLVDLRTTRSIRVAILTDDDFDASSVDPATVTLGNDDGNDTPVATYPNGNLIVKLQDFDSDGDMDLGLTFAPADLLSNGDLSASTTALYLNGQTTDGHAIAGTDEVTVIGN